MIAQSVQALIDLAVQQNKPISQLVLENQAEEIGATIDELYQQMADNFRVMQESVAAGLKPIPRSPSGLSGGDAYKLSQALANGRTIGGSTLTKGLMRAMAVSEINASMGKIVAAPTAGSCGILPGALITVMEEKQIPESKVIMSLFTAAGIGMIIASAATISGAEGGCQAECGSAAAMTAAAIVEMVGGTPSQVGQACAFALKNVLGLVCDPVAGLVEAPCVKRNAMGVANAFVAADLALADIKSMIPVDEVIAAMKSVGNMMPTCLKETAEAGLANTPTARKLAKKLLNS